MRDTTKIRQLAEEALAGFQRGSGAPDMLLIDTNLRRIIQIAADMDARTGTKDPSWWQKVQSRFR